MKSVRILLVMLALGMALIPAVFLRSGSTLADAPRPTSAQIEAACEKAVVDWVRELLVARAEGVTKQQALDANVGAPPIVLKIIAAAYGEVQVDDADFAAAVRYCVVLNKKATERHI
jgi:hypothetical protein